MAKAATELVWTKMLLEELGFSIKGSMWLWCDNQYAMHIANNLVFHERTKHIELDCHYIRDKVKEGVIALKHVHTKLQLADIFTKALSQSRHAELYSKLCLVDSPS